MTSMFHLIEHGYLCFLCWQRKYDFHDKNKQKMKKFKKEKNRTIKLLFFDRVFAFLSRHRPSGQVCS